MSHINNLKSVFQQHFKWNKARVTFLTLFVKNLITQRTVQLSSIALGLNHCAKSDSNYKRIQRFLRDFELRVESLGVFLLKILPKDIKYIITLDRTNWKFGRKDINILMLGIVYGQSSLPLCWSLLPKGGPSNYQDRKLVLDKAISLMGSEKIKCLVADREFGSKKFFRYLKSKGVKFHIRIKKTAAVRHYMKTVTNLEDVFKLVKSNRYTILPEKKLVYDEEVFIGGRRSKTNDYMIIASSDNPEEAEKTYKQRWTIENMFGYMKSKGFDFEKTHLTNYERINKLIFLVAIAMIWSYLTGLWLTNSTKIKISVKNHGRQAKSIFRIGLDFLRTILMTENKLKFEFLETLKILSCT